ncbi:MAG: hypothetical protein ACYTKD_23100 [Planctomycetota bacterium]|jgi:hypothetical protein
MRLYTATVPVAAVALLAGAAPGRAEEAWTLPTAAVSRSAAVEVASAPPRVVEDAPAPKAARGVVELRVDPEPVAPAPEAAGALLAEPDASDFQLAGALVLTAQGAKDAPQDSTSGVHRFEVAVEAAIAEGTTAFATIEAISSDGPSVFAPSFSELNANSGTTDEQFALGEAWVELARGPMTVTFGKIDMTAYVDANEFANDEMTQFISGSLVNNLAIILPDGNTPGLVASYEAGPWRATLGVASFDDSGDKLFNEAVGVFELGYGFGSDSVKGNARLMAAVDGSGEDAAGDPARDASVGLSLDLGFGEKAGLFARWGKRGVDALGAEIESAWSAGAEFHPVASRADDTIGLGYGAAIAPGGDSEGLFELYYKVALSEGAALSLHAQALTCAECDPTAETILAFGVRTLIEF